MRIGLGVARTLSPQIFLGGLRSRLDRDVTVKFVSRFSLSLDRLVLAPRTGYSTRWQISLTG